MYLQITTRCNMSCEHCAFSCTHEGKDMSLETFRTALDHCGESITIGGGEPTLHPKFWEMFGLAIGHAYNTCIITNGSMTDTALTLLSISERLEENFYVDLSQDPYHDAIDEQVVRAYKKAQRIRNVDGHIRKTGRAREFFDECDFDNSACVCDSIIVRPDGAMKYCGCDDAPIIGSVYTEESEEYLEYHNEGFHCWQEVLDSEEEDVA